MSGQTTSNQESAGKEPSTTLMNSSNVTLVFTNHKNQPYPLVYELDANAKLIKSTPTISTSIPAEHSSHRTTVDNTDTTKTDTNDHNTRHTIAATKPLTQSTAKNGPEGNTTQSIAKDGPKQSAQSTAHGGPTIRTTQSTATGGPNITSTQSTAHAGPKQQLTQSITLGGPQNRSIKRTGQNNFTNRCNGLRKSKDAIRVECSTTLIPAEKKGGSQKTLHYDTEDDIFESEPTKPKRTAEIKKTPVQDISWLDEDSDGNSWLSLLPTKERMQANDARRENRRKQEKKRRRQELREERKKSKPPTQKPSMTNTTDTTEPEPTSEHTHEINSTPYTPLTIFNTRLAISKRPTHSPHLPYPYENWPDDTFTGQYDTSQCILADAPALTREDFDKASQHLQRQLQIDNTTHQPIKPATRPPYQLRTILRPTYDVDALLQLTDFTTKQALWTLRKRNNYFVAIGASCLPGAQRGLFTTKERDDSEYICPYQGPIMTCDPDNIPTGEYNFYDPIRGVVILGNPASSYGPYANDPLDEQHANCRIAWRESMNQYWLRAEGPIADRSEILLMYGYEFWEHNQLIPQEVILRAYPQHLRRGSQHRTTQC